MTWLVNEGLCYELLESGHFWDRAEKGDKRRTNNALGSQATRNATRLKNGDGRPRDIIHRDDETECNRTRERDLHGRMEGGQYPHSTKWSTSSPCGFLFSFSRLSI
jgi:hypothetical protein